jgi:hypothetical protein
MRNRTWTDVILALTIALCVATVAAERRAPVAAETGTPTTNVADGARAVAEAVLWSDLAVAGEHSLAAADQPSRAERALDNAAQAAGAAVSELEMPFFSFGSAAAEQ